MASDLRLLPSVDVRLEQAGFTVLVCGGWAEELPGLVAPRAHHDIDLLLLDPDPAVLDEFLGASVPATSPSPVSAQSQPAAHQSPDMESSAGARWNHHVQHAPCLTGGDGLEQQPSL
ncbi:MAG TPA: hypothetical protein VNF24_02295 [Candidatus Acidoferrales bacterium]|nr:hypothetical protein [Candidatus Acidoferrales bacterium]